MIGWRRRYLPDTPIRGRENTELNVSYVLGGSCDITTMREPFRFLG